jgi:hypothetical protein
MSQWAQSLNVDPARVMLLADGEGLVHSRLGEFVCEGAAVDDAGALVGVNAGRGTHAMLG